MSTSTSTSTPIACALTPGDYAERVAWIAALNRDALRAHRLAGDTLELVYEPGAVARVADLVRRERACCAFLRFTLNEAPNAVQLTVEAPADTLSAAGDASGALFEPFLVGAPTSVDGAAGGATVCGCAGSAAARLPFTVALDLCSGG